MATVGAVPSQGEMDSLAGLANAKIPNPVDLDGPFDFSGDNWLSMLNRIRLNLAVELASNIYISEYQMPVSGPWPLSFIDTEIVGGPDFLQEVEFYFADTGETVTVTTQHLGNLFGFVAVLELGQTSIKVDFIIGGNHTARLKTRIKFKVELTGSSPSALVTGPPGFNGSWLSNSPGDLTQTLYFYRDFDIDIDPGSYSLTVDFTDCVSRQNQIEFAALNGVFISNGVQDGDYFELYVTNSNSVSTDGIHSTFPVRKIKTEDVSLSPSGFPFGLFVLYQPDEFRYISGSNRYTSTVEGLWFGKSRAIPRVPIDVAAWMPWNPIDSNGAPTGAQTHEEENRMMFVPRYPFFKLGEVDPRRLPEYYSRWTSFNPEGFWIYKVYLHRGPTIENGINVARDPNFPINVELGCIRNGTFVSFGTYITGTIVDAMWPIFTRDALVYRNDNDEEVDVQAVVIRPQYSGGDAPCAYPISAACYNDTAALLNLL